MKNIYIEGIQGMGKSTLLNCIMEKFPEYRVCREGDYSPIELAWCTWMTEEEYHQTLKDYDSIREEIIKNTVREGEHYIVTYTKIITDIPNFHRELEKYEIYNGRRSLHDLKEIVTTRYWNFTKTGYLFECSFLQNIVEDLILFHELSDDEILEFYHKLYKGINQEEFLLLYLYSDKLEESIETIKKERLDEQGNEIWYALMTEYLVHSPYGEKHGYQGFEDMIVHFRHRQQLELTIINEVIGERAVILPAKNWKMEEIATLLLSPQI